MDNNTQRKLDKIYQCGGNARYVLFFDTETTGLLKSDVSTLSSLTDWPRIVQFSWIFADTFGDRIEKFDYIIKPDGFIIPEEATKIHGITTDKAIRKGTPLKDVLEQFSVALSRARFLVAHNLRFDEDIIRAEYMRAELPYMDLSKNRICTMLASTDFCRLPGPYDSYKWPKLVELHHRLFSSEFVEKHDAAHDVSACAKCFFKLQDIGVIRLGQEEPKYYNIMHCGGCSKIIHIPTKEMYAPSGDHMVVIRCEECGYDIMIKPTKINPAAINEIRIKKSIGEQSTDACQQHAWVNDDDYLKWEEEEYEKKNLDTPTDYYLAYNRDSGASIKAGYDYDEPEDGNMIHEDDAVHKDSDSEETLNSVKEPKDANGKDALDNTDFDDLWDEFYDECDVIMLTRHNGEWHSGFDA